MNSEKYVQKYFSEANLHSVAYTLRNTRESVVVSEIIIDDNRYCAVSDNRIIPIHLFEKPTSRSPFKKESGHFKEFGDELTKISSIKINGFEFEFDDFVRINSSCKADFAFKNADKEIVWISHKDGSTDRHFVHFGGVSHLKNDPIIQHFVAKHKERYDRQPNYTVGMILDDEELRLKSVYGKDYGAELSRDNVSFVVQGKMTIDDNSLVANKIIENGNSLPDKTFMLYSRRSLDRSDCGLSNCRLSIGTTDSRLVKDWIVNEN